MTLVPPPPDPTPATPGVPAGWYPDQTGQHRWWDGNAWGAYAPPPQTLVLQRPPTQNGIAVAGLVLGVVGALLALIPILGLFLCWLPALLAIIFGFVGISVANGNRGLRRGEAVGAVILGFSPIGIFLVQVLIGSAMAASS